MVRVRRVCHVSEREPLGTLESLHGQVVVGDILSLRPLLLDRPKCFTGALLYLELAGNGPFQSEKVEPFAFAFAVQGLPATIAGEFRW